ncbi:uncharacterized protein [Elaeis guineensis]|uniref:Uncharacterized protein LOC105040315 n=1 Tax=Elaeis guineensis var. tenera TaxID=51953 RepID=A0A6I9QU28_ELAGV|nr:uncharacterized protein LOC105040315 [Elaeis guineensis]
MARRESGREGGAEGPAGDPNPRPRRPAGTPWVEVHLFRRGRGPIDIFRSSLGGRDQDRLEVRSILARYRLKSVFAFKPPSERGFPIRFSPDGTSLHPYRDGTVVFIDGEPKDSLLKPVIKILIGIAVPTLLIVILIKELPETAKASRLATGLFPPWLLACMLVLFTRLRKRPRTS